MYARNAGQNYALPYEPGLLPNEPSRGDQNSTLKAPSSINQSESKKRDISNIVINVVLVLSALALALSFIAGTSSGAPRMFAGYSASVVLTGSMADVYPIDTLLVVHATDPEELSVGDDIAFMASADTAVTHRIVEVLPQTPKTDGTRELAFRTKGTVNAKPDADLVFASNVVGKVVFSSYPLGAVVVFCKNNWPALLFLLVIAFAFVAYVRRIDAKHEEDDQLSRSREEEASLREAAYVRAFPPEENMNLRIAHARAAPASLSETRRF